MEARKCKYCSEVIPSSKRADTKFCSNSCKAHYWEQTKGEAKVQPVKIEPTKQIILPEKSIEGLRGVIDNKPKSDVIDVKLTSTTADNTLFRTETQAHKKTLAEIEELKIKQSRLIGLKQKCDEYLSNWISEKKRIELQPWRPSPQINSWIQAEERFWTQTTTFKNPELEKALGHIKDLMGIKSKLNKMVQIANDIHKTLLTRLALMQRYEPAGKLGGLARLPHKPEQKLLLSPVVSAPVEIEVQQEQEPQVFHDTVIQSNSKLISSQQLREMNYKCLNFHGKWKELFGLPAVVFHLAVHGKPGEGKSTFCIQMADYLAKNFGHVVYISGEEGFSKTLRDKVVNNKIDNPYLYFADISSFEQIKTEIETNKFHFIFIDSLDTLRIDVLRLRELRELYPQSAFITISQSTKDGKMRGSQEIIHDTDIAIKVEDGIAITSKNRYHPRGTEFQIFPPDEKPK